MEYFFYIIFCIAGILSGALVSWLIMKAKSAGINERIKILNEENDKNKYLNNENSNLKIEIAELKKTIEAYGDKINWLEKIEEKFREAFESLSAKTLKMNTSQFINQSKEQIEFFLKQMRGDWGLQKEEFKNIIDPIDKDLKKLDVEVKEMEQKRRGAYEKIDSQIKNFIISNNKLADAAYELKNALKSSAQRGKWGEVQLRRIVEMAGMLDHVDFEEQAVTDAGRPDMIVNLPNKGILPVDAKVPMESYLSACESTDEKTIQMYLDKHKNSLRNHMRQLSQRAYWMQFERSPEFVVMLIPYESGLSAAFLKDPGLLEDALKSKVIIVSPATLLALLKVVAYGWMQLKLSESAQKIADQGKELYKRFKTFNQHFTGLGDKLSSTITAYNKTASSMDSRIMPAVKTLKELGAGSEEINDPVLIEENVKKTKEIIE